MIYLIYYYFTNILDRRIYFIGDDLNKGLEMIQKDYELGSRQLENIKNTDTLEYDEDNEVIISDYLDGEVQLVIKKVENNSRVY